MMSSSMRHQECSTPPSSPNWVKKLNHQLQNLPQTRSAESERWKHEAIYKIPPSLKKLSSSAYEPQTVSIGPYHHGHPQLEGMEKHKQRALHNFLERHDKPLESYVAALEQAFELLRNAYGELDSKWRDKEAFLELMMVDGCFILEVLMLTANAEGRRKIECRYAENDPVFSCGVRLYLGPYLRRDMLMLENQLPMKVLATILDVAQGGATLDLDGLSKQDQLNELILGFFSPPQQASKKGFCSRILRFLHRHESSKKEPLGECLHILDLYRKSLLSSSDNDLLPKQPRTSCLSCGDEEEADVYTSSATELREAGIQFEKSRTRRLDDVSFSSRGVLELPLIVVDDAVESEYLNLMAFERLHVGAGSGVTSFVFFMDKIIDSAKDVGLLHRRGIVQNLLGSDEDVAKLFNTLSREVCPDPDHKLSGVHRDVVRYSRSPLHRWIAYAKHNYFTNPLVGLSVVAAILLFLLTVIQTVYSVKAYYSQS